MTASTPRASRWRAAIAWGCGFAGLVLLIAGGVVFVYQAYFSWLALTDGFDRAANAVPGWVRWTLVDLSLVTPGLVVHCGYRVVRGSWWILRAPASWMPDDTFPFPKRYRAFYVNMGLLGTLVGFVIAFQNPAATIQTQANVLLQSLSTAVWSSLTAVALAYGVCPVFELACQWPLTRPVPLRLQLDLVSARALAMADALDRATESLAKAGVQLDLTALASDVTVVKTQVASIQSEIVRMTASVDRLAGQQESEVRALRRDIQELRTAAQSYTSSADVAAQIAVLRGESASAADLRRAIERWEHQAKRAGSQRSLVRRTVNSAVTQLRRLEQSMNHDEPEP